MRCLVLGGGGFIGSAVTDRLLETGHTVRVLARVGREPFRDVLGEPRLEWMEGDFLDIDDMRAAVRDMDVVLHMISTTIPSTAKDDPVWDVQSNVVGSLRLLEAIREAGVRRVIYISSGGTVYGESRYLPIDEGHPTDPYSPYAISKLAIEKHILALRRTQGTSPIVLRVANVYGQRQRLDVPQGAIGAFIERALDGEPIEVWGDGSVTRDYVHVDDVADVFARAVSYRGAESVFNVGTGLGTSLNELVKLLEEELGHRIARIHRHPRDMDVRTNVLDISRAQRSLGWRPKISIREGLRRSIMWAISVRSASP